MSSYLLLYLGGLVSGWMMGGVLLLFVVVYSSVRAPLEDV